MRFFQPKLNICSECQVAFQPATGYEGIWNHLCSVHRKPFVDKQRHIDRVVAWAKSCPDAATALMEVWEAREKEQIGTFTTANAAFNQSLWGHK